MSDIEMGNLSGAAPAPTAPAVRGEELSVELRERSLSHSGPAMFLSFHGLDFSVAIKPPKRGAESAGAGAAPVSQKQILRGVTGYVAPGELVALMGSSGAGKTSLLNILAGNNKKYSGAVRMNGFRMTRELRRQTAFCQQEDVFLGSLTVAEHMYYQARFRMPPNAPESSINARVEELLGDLGLRKCKDTVIGTQLLKGISGGEKKRLAFASEIVNNPSLLFVDEPTSGLDSYMAESVVRTLKSMTARGRTVVATIHQPSSQVYQLFDKVMFLAEGRIAYFGPRDAALPYFAALGYACPEYTNPADYFIQVSAGG